MSDLVERLRDPQIRLGRDTVRQLVLDGPTTMQLLRDAADEIDRLRAQVVSLQSSLDAGPPRPGKKTPDALEKP